MHAALDLLAKVELSPGKHDTRDDGMCVMECVAYVAGEPHTDVPRCACEVATFLAIHANDVLLPCLSAELSCRVLALAGSKVGPAQTQARAYFAVDQVVRRMLPDALEQTDLAVSNALRSLPALDAPEKLEILKDAADLLRALSRRVHGARLAILVQHASRALRQGAHGKGAYRVTQLLELAAASSPNDLLRLLDGVLAVGASPLPEPTPTMRLRIAQLATRVELAGRPLTRED